MDQLLGQEDLLIEKLEAFYTNEKNFNTFTSIVKEGNFLSLRLLDWFVTNYSKQNIVYISGVDIHSDYKNHLKGFKKHFFDPFRRRRRVQIVHDGSAARIVRKPGKEDPARSADTTIGQLNFFMWCIESGIIDYIVCHINEIENCMTSCSLKQPKRAGLHKTNRRVVVKFE